VNSPSNPHHGLAPAPWIVRFAPLVGPRARVLDLAAGYGRHARFFAARGACVVAVDRDAAALATLGDEPRIETRVADLEQGAWPFSKREFDGIVVVHYLHRALFPRLIDALADDGVLLYETFAHGNAVYRKPSNPAFLLEPGELLELARERLTVVAFEQGRIEGDHPAVIQRLAAVGSKRAWPPLLPGGLTTGRASACENGMG
jgi:SAM-dependent methyltransferase